MQQYRATQLLRLPTEIQVLRTRPVVLNMSLVGL